MPKINDPVLNSKIKSYVEGQKRDTRAIERMTYNLSNISQVNQMSPLGASADRKARSVSPIKNATMSSAVELSPSAANSRIRDDLLQVKIRNDDLERELKRKDSQVNTQ